MKGKAQETFMDLLDHILPFQILVDMFVRIGLRDNNVQTKCQLLVALPTPSRPYYFSFKMLMI